MQKPIFPLLAGSLLLAAFTTPAGATPAVVEFQTNLGTIAIQLDAARAPVTVTNFLNYVNSGFYKDTIIHRVIKGFMMQSGGLNKLDGKFKAPIAAAITNEASNGLSNLTGTVAMARTSDPNSATSQFFINLVDNKFLDYGSTYNPNGYAVFGKVVAGMTVAKKIESLLTYSSPFADLPFTADSGLVSIDAVYTSDSLNVAQSTTRILLNGSGKVVSTPAGIDCGVSCSMTQPTGSAIALTATASIGYYFSGWRGDCGGFRRGLKLNTTHGNHNCTAVFSKLGAALQ